MSTAALRVVVRGFAGSVLVTAALAKVIAGTPVLQGVEMDAFRRYGSALIIAAEMWIGLGVCLGRARRRFAFLFLAFMIGTSVLHGAHMLDGHGAARCDCFGDLFVLSHRAAFVRSLALALCGVILVFATPPHALVRS